ncbi:MAG: hypothetical protein HRT68_12310 [Flavobacteriaceae bacterium]|nr:hypothetical protein [Flavobacteriaceae bacterium]
MNKYLLIITLLFSLSIMAQEEENTSSASDEDMGKAMEMMMNPKEVTMEVNEDLYSKADKNTYVNAKQTAGIMAMQMPATIEKMRKDMDKGGQEGYEVLDKGSFNENGIEVLFIYYKVQKAGQNMMMDMYCKKYDDKSTITITGFYQVGEGATYKEAIKKAAVSAIIN